MIVIKFLAFGLLLLSLSFAQELISKRVSKTTLDPFDKVWDQAKEPHIPAKGIKAVRLCFHVVPKHVLLASSGSPCGLTSYSTCLTGYTFV